MNLLAGAKGPAFPRGFSQALGYQLPPLGFVRDRREMGMQRSKDDVMGGFAWRVLKCVISNNMQE
jgi:hypothetical protein